MISVGLDISSKNIAIVEVIKTRKGIAIKNTVDFEIPAESIIKGELQDSVVLGKRLKETLRRSKISSREVFVGISNLKTIVKEIELPLVDESEISNSLKYQINDFIPIPKNNILYDFYVMEKQKSSSRIMLVGAVKSMIMNVIEAIKDAGLIAQAIDLNCFSLYRTLDHIYNFSKNNKSLCAVNLGQDISIIEIIENDTLKFPRFLSDSVSTFSDKLNRMTDNDNDISNKIINDFDFSKLLKSPAGVKKIKDFGKPDLKDNNSEVIMAVKDNKSTSNKKTEKIINDENIIKTISDTADSLVDEIKMSMEHYIQENPKAVIEKIVLTGRNLLNFEKYIKQETNYKVEKLDCSGSFNLDSLKKKPAYNSRDFSEILNPLALGMAIRGIKQ